MLIFELCLVQFIVTFSDLFSISQPDPIAVTLVDSTEVSCFGEADGSARITITGGTEPYSFKWTGDTTGHISTMDNPDDLVADMYDLTVKDAKLCEPSLPSRVS